MSCADFHGDFIIVVVGAAHYFRLYLYAAAVRSSFGAAELLTIP